MIAMNGDFSNHRLQGQYICMVKCARFLVAVSILKMNKSQVLSTSSRKSDEDSHQAIPSVSISFIYG